MKLALGTVQFGLPYGIANVHGQVSKAEVAAILSVARSAGIDTLDTAIAYGDSEERLGAAGVGRLHVITKVPPIPEGLEDAGGWLYEQIHASLRRLRVETLYGVLMHRSQQLTGPAARPVVESLERLKAQGVVRKIGVSIYSPDELEAAASACALDLVQAPFNLVDRRLLTGGWLRRLRDAGVEIHARSVFLQGLLLMPRAAIPGKFERWGQLWDLWHEWLRRAGVSAAEACIGFAQSFTDVSRVVVGVDSAAQLEQLVAASGARAAGAWPAIDSEDEALINPSNWNSL